MDYIFVLLAIPMYASQGLARASSGLGARQLVDDGIGLATCCVEVANVPPDLVTASSGRYSEVGCL